MRDQVESRPVQGASPCVACFGMTDTGVGCVGSLEFQAGLLVALGLTVEEALNTAMTHPDHEQPQYECVVRVCGDCASRTGFVPALVIVGADLPCFVQ